MCLVSYRVHPGTNLHLIYSGFAWTRRSGSFSGEVQPRGTRQYHFVRRYLEHNPQLPLSLRQVDPLIRQLTLYRDLIENRTRQEDQS